MKRSSILAHRGLFTTHEEKNSPLALRRALQEGYGIETDLRDSNGQIVISHDPPLPDSHPVHFDSFLQEIASYNTSSRIALNIKSDGLSNLIERSVLRYTTNPSQFFVFDMSVPDSLGYSDSSIPVYSRISEYESTATLPSFISGIWIDNFSGLFPQIEHAIKLIDKGLRVTIVSSELHRRDHTTLWDRIDRTGIHLSPLFELCTDFPEEAAKRFCIL